MGNRVRLGWVLLALIACSQGGGDSDQSDEGTDRERGRELFLRNGCAVCHGEQGRGDGAVARTLKPPPRDFRELEAYKQGQSVEQIARTLKEGVPGSSMPAYPHLSEEQRSLIATYINYLQED